MRKLMAVALLCLASNAMASKWVELPSSPGGAAKASYDKQSLKREGSKVDVWIRQWWATPGQLEDAQFDSAMVRWRFDCQADSYSTRASTYKLGETITKTYVGESAVQLVSPDSWVEAVERAVCR